MCSSHWSKVQLEEVEVAPQTQASVKFGEVELKDLGQVLTPTQVATQHFYFFVVEYF